MTISPRRYSRVSCRHSMSGMGVSCGCAAGAYRRFPCDTDALAVRQAIVVGDELIARRQPGDDRDPPILLRLTKLEHAMHRHIFPRIDHPRGRCVSRSMDEV